MLKLVRQTATSALMLLGISLVIGPLQAMADQYGETQHYSATEKLELIKRALVDLALGTDVKLSSAAYLDNQGVLHESTVLSSQAQVRGVRVLSYLEEAGIPSARLSTKVLSDTSCLGSRSGLRRQATVRGVFAGSIKRYGDHYTSELSDFAVQTLINVMAASADWSVLVEKQYASFYQRLVSGSAADRVPYRFDILLHQGSAANQDKVTSDAAQYTGYNGFAHAAAKSPPTYSSKLWPAGVLNYELILVERATGRSLWQHSLALKYPAVSRGYAKSPVPSTFKHNMLEATEALVANVTKAMACHADAYPLSAVVGDNNRATINAGVIAGVRIGDQFLLSENANIFNQALSQSGLQALALAEVESVSAHGAVIKHIAGKKWSETEPWHHRVALPF